MSLTTIRRAAEAEWVRRIAFVVFDGFQILDLTGPFEVFQQANWPTGAYDVRVIAATAGPVRSATGLTILATDGVADIDPTTIDTVVVAGGIGVEQAITDTALLTWIRAAAASARRIASVCSGAFLLAAAGLLDGCRVTTHWSRARQLSEAYPQVRVDPEPIFIKDGRVWTSAGVTAGMDLALALVEHDIGRDIAHGVARQLVLFLRRPGDQSQFSVAMRTPPPSSDPISATVSAIHARPGDRHSLADLARHAGLSPRHLQRRFTAELGASPAAYVERVHVEAAQRALTESDDPLDTVARRCGFGTAETMRRTFHRTLGVAPSDYRDRFRSTIDYAQEH
ncbi:helix-turn-helix domain-containing protein [Nocardia panacis]|uniref:Helix-turn-helix domain-containing protein n=1 Tax=Nocardia panacis TaxID=2340916 RepID=A0A3A4KAX1_9NOCA|nr:DJ-1/PfpI family protein [Nocardia panacis]RJO72228.1 helix-turn-helix domain-containing protein [Nocardia panacis]